MVVVLTFIFIAIIVFQIWSCIKQKQVKELVVSMVMLLVGMFYAYSKLLDRNPPELAQLMIAVYKPVSRFFMDRLLG